MKTDQLIDLLARDPEPVPPRAVTRRLAVSLGLGLPLALWVMASQMGLRPDLSDALAHGMFWIKLAFCGGLAWCAWLGVERLARPGIRLGRVGVALVAPVLLLWLLAAFVMANATALERPALWMGSTWRNCPFNIMAISLPLFVALMWAMKGLAPTRPMLAGGLTGLLAGALGALVYALHCPESAAPFLAIWYVLGIAIPTLAGALTGPRLLRW